MISRITLTDTEIREAVAKYVGSVAGVNAAAANVVLAVDDVRQSGGVLIHAVITVEKR